MAWAADTIAWTPVPHSRLTVTAGASFGTPALIPTTRAMYMSSGAVWITLPNTTWSTCSGCRPARSTAARAAMETSSVGATLLRLLPNDPIGVRAADAITTSLIVRPPVDPASASSAGGPRRARGQHGRKVARRRARSAERTRPGPRPSLGCGTAETGPDLMADSLRGTAVDGSE